jgi:hypothetical protein
VQIDPATLSSDELRALLALQQLAGEKRNRSLSKQELGHRAGLTVPLVDLALQRLAERGHIQLEGKDLVLDSDGLVFRVPLSDTFKNTEAALVAENASLRQRVIELENQEVSGLADKLHDEPAKVVRLAEHLLKRGLTHLEVYYLALMINRYGSARVIKVLNASRSATEPLRAAWAKLERGAYGKPANRLVVDPVAEQVWEPDTAVDPYSVPEGGT